MGKYAILVLVLVVAACGPDEPRTPPNTPSFSAGQIVEFKAFPVRGMVVSFYCPNPWPKSAPAPACRYSIRTMAPQMATNTHVFRADDAISGNPTALIENVREFEIRSPLTKEN